MDVSRLSFLLGRRRLWHEKQGVVGGGRSGWNAWRKKRLIGNTYCDRRKRAMQEGGRGEDKNVVKRKRWRRDKGREDEL